jgi:predicted Zn-dependent protease
VEARELNAEALESLGKWDEAAQEYRAILVAHPDAPGIHYRLGRLLLSAPQTAGDAKQQAKNEFELELKADPKNAGAHFVLGELARQADDLPTAVREFTAATGDDPSFAEAQLGLGRVLLATDQPAKAVAPLEAAGRLQPRNPEVHFQLATAYRKLGRTADANREAKMHRDALAHIAAAQDEMHRQVTGDRASPSQAK